ncbi:hypothetical protein ABW21_db0205848 [Orbilia brochopaga]|nr:hypothetical protein ABW21_db0205848 [Drechslerella brochopaga]
MSGHTKKLSFSGLVPPQQPSTPANSDCGPSQSEYILSDAIDGHHTTTSEHERLIKGLQNIRNCVSKLEKFNNSIGAGDSDASHEAAKMLLDFINETHVVQDQISKTVLGYSKLTENLSFLKKERMEEFGNGTGRISSEDSPNALIYIRAEIETEIQKIEEGIDNARDRPSDDIVLTMPKKVVDGSEYDTRPKRFNTARY